MRDVLANLAQSRRRFLAFALSRVREPTRAEELVQAAFARAASSRGPDDETKADAWFFQVLRNVIIDDARAVSARARLADGLATTDADQPNPDQKPCACVGRAFDSLDADKAAALSAVVVDEQRVAAFAAAAGITANAASVRLHRAKSALERTILAMCGPCCARGCGACACA